MKTRIKELRAANSMTQAKLAELAGISRTHLSEIESCKTIPSITVAQSIAKALKSTVDQVFFCI